MNEETFNISIRKFLKMVGVSSQREIEQACRTGTQAVTLLSGLRSDRGAEYLEDFRRRLTPFSAEPSVREFGARLEAQEAA